MRMVLTRMVTDCAAKQVFDVPAFSFGNRSKDDNLVVAQAARERALKMQVKRERRGGKDSKVWSVRLCLQGEVR